jgi:hypothetical protein
MIDILQGYIDDFKEFLPRTYESSPITQSVKDKLIEVMSKEIREFISYDSDGNLLNTSIVVEDNAPFDLGLLPEALDLLGCDFTYYKWENLGSVHELNLYRVKPPRDRRYQEKLALFIGGYITSILLAFACMGFLYYFFYLLSICSTKPAEVVEPSLWFEVGAMLFMTSLMVVFFIDAYIYFFRKTSVAQFLRREVYFDKLENIDKPTMLS